MKYKTFFIIFKGLSLKQIKKVILEGESATLNQSQNTSTFKRIVRIENIHGVCKKYMLIEKIYAVPLF